MQIIRSVDWRTVQLEPVQVVAVRCHRCETEIMVTGVITRSGCVVNQVECPHPGCGWQDFVQLDGYEA